MENIKLIVSDVDGVWTDGAFYYSENGDAMRKFNTRDSYGVSLANLMNISILILSGEDNLMVRQRFEKLQIKNLRLGVGHKLLVINDYCNKIGIPLESVAFVGDDMNDYCLLGKVGLFACPKNANWRIRQKANLVLSSKGGKGAFREFVEKILDEKGLLEEAYKQYVRIGSNE